MGMSEEEWLSGYQDYYQELTGNEWTGSDRAIGQELEPGEVNYEYLYSLGLTPEETKTYLSGEYPAVWERGEGEWQNRPGEYWESGTSIFPPGEKGSGREHGGTPIREDLAFGPGGTLTTYAESLKDVPAEESIIKELDSLDEKDF